MTNPEVIELAPYSTLPYVFMPLEGQGDDTVLLVCTAEDWHWKLDPHAFAEQWPEVLESMRDHQRTHAW